MGRRGDEQSYASQPYQAQAVEQAGAGSGGAAGSQIASKSPYPIILGRNFDQSKTTAPADEADDGIAGPGVNSQRAHHIDQRLTLILTRIRIAETATQTESKCFRYNDLSWVGQALPEDRGAERRKAWPDLMRTASPPPGVVVLDLY
jgi:hypothetical protein